MPLISVHYMPKSVHNQTKRTVSGQLQDVSGHHHQTHLGWAIAQSGEKRSKQYFCTVLKRSKQYFCTVFNKEGRKEGRKDPLLVYHPPNQPTNLHCVEYSFAAFWTSIVHYHGEKIIIVVWVVLLNTTKVWSSAAKHHHHNFLMYLEGMLSSGNFPPREVCVGLFLFWILNKINQINQITVSSI
jgi:hypothetical protein